jgi:hypothetical protein
VSLSTIGASAVVVALEKGARTLDTLHVAAALAVASVTVAADD